MSSADDEETTSTEPTRVGVSVGNKWEDEEDDEVMIPTAAYPSTIITATYSLLPFSTLACTVATKTNFFLFTTGSRVVGCC